MSVSINLPWRTPPVTNNQRGQHHTLARKRATTRLEARLAIAAQRPGPMQTPCMATIHLQLADRRIRDADNLALTLKCVLDEVVRAGVLPGDDWRYVPITAQRIHPAAKGERARMWLELVAL